VFEKLGTRAFPNVTLSMLESHDLSKLSSFVEVVGYTEKWIRAGSFTADRDRFYKTLFRTNFHRQILDIFPFVQ
jgi:hypothetical protein